MTLEFTAHEDALCQLCILSQVISLSKLSFVFLANRVLLGICAVMPCCGD